MGMEKFRGIFPALLTPFQEDETVNHAALRQLVRMNLDKGVTGFYVCGSTGEAFLLSPRERKEILETVADEAAGKATIIAHVGCISQNQATDLARHAARCGVDAISSVPPFYYGFTFDEIRDYYFALADAAERPVLIYNFPAFSGVKLTVDNIRVFMGDARFMGVKHTSSDYYMLERIKEMRADAIVYNGYDEMFLSGLAMGADGGIGSTYNFMAEKFIRIMDCFREGDLAQARQVQRQANNVIQALIQVGVFQGEKMALQLQGIDMGVCRRPFAPPKPGQMEQMRKVLAENDCMVL